MRRCVYFAIALAGSIHAQDRSLIQIPDARKLALVIGNSEYPKAPLKNPVNDAVAMETTLKKLGFQVTIVRNADLRRMRGAIDDFAAQLGPGSLGFFYFAGHGVQVNSVNYLLPVDFSASSEDDIQYEAYPASRIQAKLEGSGARLRVLVLDACRNNPFRYKRDSSEGLAAMSINAEGTLVAFATGDNNTAGENPAESNGLYTKYLIPALLTPGLNLRDAFQKAKEDVYRVSQRQQNPSIYENIVGQYALLPASLPVKPSTGVPPAVPPPGAPRSPTPTQADPARTALAAQTWAAIKDSKNARDFDDFVAVFPQSEMAPAAILRASELRRNPVQLPRSGPQLVQAAPISPPPKAVPGATKVNPKDGLTYVWIPAGSFLMGCSPDDNLCAADEKPSHPVTLSKGFWMGQTPVTNAAWKKLPFPSGWTEREISREGKILKLGQTTAQENAPAVGMLWDEARVFCEHVGGRLPTEAEWEYAARAGTTGPRYAKLAAISVSTDASGKALTLAGPAPVAQKEKNAWNLYDLYGNVGQWTADRHGANYYQNSVERDPPGSPEGMARVLRGGSFERNSGGHLRASGRMSLMPNKYGYDMGFRCVLE
jgi:formylglycine-generating enzyme required for sulfatase activity